MKTLYALLLACAAVTASHAALPGAEVTADTARSAPGVPFHPDCAAIRGTAPHEVTSQDAERDLAQFYERVQREGIQASNPGAHLVSGAFIDDREQIREVTAGIVTELAPPDQGLPQGIERLVITRVFDDVVEAASWRQNEDARGRVRRDVWLFEVSVTPPQRILRVRHTVIPLAATNGLAGAAAAEAPRPVRMYCMNPSQRYVQSQWHDLIEKLRQVQLKRSEVSI
jgi:hypothetical protein